jgi:uncharacterized phage infection (PIP) family protein YhgE
MKNLLTTLTLAITTVVVAVVAYHLVGIAVALTRANDNLARLAGGLEAIRDNTAPLGEDLTTINGAAIGILNGLTSVDENLVKVITAVQVQR